MYLSTALDAFLKYLKLEKQRSIYTISSYQIDLQQFLEYLIENKKTNIAVQIEDIDSKTLTNWLITLKNKDYKHTTLNRKIFALKAFFNFLVFKDIIAKPLSDKLIAFKTDKHLAEYLTQRDLLGVLDNFEDSEDFEKIRNRLILEVLYGTGIRNGELINLKITDIDLSRGLIQVQGKGQKIRLIPLYERLKGLIKNYLEKRILYAKDDHFFVTKKGRGLYKVLVNRVLKQFFMEIDIDQKSAHTLRHTFATHLLNNGATLNVIKELLGHASLNSTQIYTHTDLNTLKKNLENLPQV